MARYIKVKKRCQVIKITNKGKKPIVYMKCFGKPNKKGKKKQTAQEIINSIK